MAGPIRGAARAAGRGLASGFRTIALAFVLGFTAMLVSFLVVYGMAGKWSDETAVSPETLQRAHLLRIFSNELVTLCNTYHRRVPQPPGILPAIDRTWLDRTFRPDLQFLEQRMDDTMPGDAEVFLQLRAAAARCGAMARNPADAALRAGALGEVARAVAAAEASIAQVGTTVRGAPPRVPPRFL